ncbi:IPT/TIG domain-containing protein [bacterium A37T11]|nr:IPT/TIG domain-containing protein [bacterium A37T11]
MKFKFYTMLAILAGFIGCKNKEGKDITLPATDNPAKVDLYMPTNGGASTQLSLYGNNFGTDISQIRVTVNGVDATVTGSNGRVITATVQKNSGSGPVMVFIGKDSQTQELTYKYPFQYQTQFLISTYLGKETAGIDDGNFTTTTLRRPRYLRWGVDGTLYFIEEGENTSGNGGIRVAKDNKVTTLVRNTTSGGAFDRIRSIDLNLNEDKLFVSNDIKVTGSIGLGAYNRGADGFANLAPISTTSGLTLVRTNPVSGEQFVAVYSGAKICKLVNGNLQQLCQLPGPDGTTPMSSANVNALVFSKDGQTIYIVTRDKQAIYKANYDIASGAITQVALFAGAIGKSGYVDGPGTSAMFNNPCQADLDADGNLYVADRSNSCIRKISPDGGVTTYVGIGGTAGFKDGDQKSALFKNPEGCQFGPDGALYIADFDNNRIRRVFVE